MAGGAGESLLTAVFLCAAIHVAFIGFGIEGVIYDTFGTEHPHMDHA